MKISKYRFLVLFALALSLMIGCQEDEALKSIPGDSDQLQSISRHSLYSEANPDPATMGPFAPVAVELIDIGKFGRIEATLRNGDIATLTPVEIVDTVMAGEVITEQKNAHIPGAPPKGELVFSLDLTGSMGTELAQVKAHCTAITTAVKALIDSTRFGVASHMDYPDSYTYCEYSSTYGDASYGDYPGQVDQPLTNDDVAVKNMINGLSLGNGVDGPESYSRVFYEARKNAGWTVGPKKIILAWLDMVPHDCNFDAILGGSGTTGVDPGPDGTMGNADDLEILAELDSLVGENITLIVLYSGSSTHFALWNAYAQRTGGEAMQLPPDATYSGDEIAALVVNLIQNAVSVLDEVYLEAVPSDPYASWLTSVSPAVYEDVELPFTGPFDVEITVPPGTPDGVYEFDIALMGDGVKYAQQHVRIVVENEIPVPFDVHPTSCPNPINTKSGGVMPTAILGTDDFDIRDIDPTTVKVEGVSPLRWAYEDVATPYTPYLDKRYDRMACNSLHADGFSDLTLKFSNREIAAALGAVSRGHVLKLHMTGMTYGGAPIVGEDIIWIVK